MRSGGLRPADPAYLTGRGNTTVAPALCRRQETGACCVVRAVTSCPPVTMPERGVIAPLWGHCHGHRRGRPSWRPMSRGAGERRDMSAIMAMVAGDDDRDDGPRAG